MDRWRKRITLTRFRSCVRCVISSVRDTGGWGWSSVHVRRAADEPLPVRVIHVVAPPVDPGGKQNSRLAHFGPLSLSRSLTSSRSPRLAHLVSLTLLTSRLSLTSANECGEGSLDR
eukprot:6927869-Prymnesium_polylepis.1